MGIQLTDTMMRSLKGAPGNILLFFILRFINGQTETVNQRYIQQMTGYSDKTVEDALLYLFERKLVIRNNRYNWGLSSENLTQLPLMVSLLGRGDNNESEDCEQKSEESVTGTRNNSVSDQSTDTEILRVQESNPKGIRNNSVSPKLGESEILRVQDMNMVGIRNNSVSEAVDTENLRVDCSSSSRYINTLDIKIKQQLLDLGESEFLRVIENLQTCDEYGITDPAKTRLSFLKTTTPTLIRYHCETLSNSDTLGAAVYRIEKNWRISQKWFRDQEHKREFNQATAWAETDDLFTNSFPDAEISQEKLLSVLKAIESSFSQANYSTWIKPLRLIDAQEGEWTVSVCNQYAGAWIKEYALEKLESVSGVKIKIVCNGKEIV